MSKCGDVVGNENQVKHFLLLDQLEKHHPFYPHINYLSLKYDTVRSISHSIIMIKFSKLKNIIVEMIA